MKPDRADHYQTGCVNNSMGLGRSISVVLPEDAWAALNQIAKAQNKSKAHLVRQLILNYLDDA